MEHKTNAINLAHACVKTKPRLCVSTFFSSNHEMRSCVFKKCACACVKICRASPRSTKCFFELGGNKHPEPPTTPTSLNPITPKTNPKHPLPSPKPRPKPQTSKNPNVMGHFLNPIWAQFGQILDHLAPNSSIFGTHILTHALARIGLDTPRRGSPDK